MAKILKASIGIMFTERIFRLSTQAGVLIDDLLTLRGKKLDIDSFESVSRDPLSNNLRLFNEDSGIYLSINLDSITFTYDLYDLDSHFNFDDFITKFKAIWETFDARIDAPDIRRIGFVTEQRFNVKNGSSRLLVDKLTTLNSEGFPAKFNLAFEDRKNVGHGGLLDPTKDDFINIIRSFYDSSIDTEHPEEGAINANLDIQRYFTPALKKAPFDEIKKLKAEYDKVAVKFGNEVDKLGINYGKAA
jgi:uncharacterized protein (TIGR04255 family)